MRKGERSGRVAVFHTATDPAAAMPGGDHGISVAATAPFPA
jgi:hypothetical protein